MEDIKVDLGEIGWDGRGCIDLVKYRDKWRVLVNTVMNLSVSQNVGKLSGGCRTGGPSKRA
jgi:hypothetical protein